MTGFLTGKYVGDWRLAEDTEISGAVIGAVTVGAGLSLRMRGRIGGDLVLEAGARAQVIGAVDGAIRNHGGELDLNGDFRPDQMGVATPSAPSPQPRAVQAPAAHPAEVVTMPAREPPPPAADHPAEPVAGPQPEA